MPELTVLLSDLPNPDRRLVGGKAVNIAVHFEIDDVIDPAASRTWIRSLADGDRPMPSATKKRPYIDTW